MIRGAANVPLGVLSFAIDTTDLEQARVQLRDRERQLRTILDAIPMFVAHVDPQLKFTFANRAYEALTHCSPTDLIGCSIMDLHGPRFAAMLPHVQTVLGTAISAEEEVTFASGERRSMVVQRIPDIGEGGAVQGYFVVATDVTESKRVEAVRIKEEHRLREAVSSEVHHRVKNSLQGIVGLLRAQAAKNPNLANALAPAISQVLSISVGFGLTSTRGEHGIVLCDMVHEIGRNLELITGASISTATDHTLLNQPIVLDRSHAVNLSVIVNELIYNAVKHGKAPAEGPRVIVSMSRTPESSTVCISSRIGSTPIEFDFPSGKGLGTGLSLVRALLPPRGAELSFASDDGQVRAVLKLHLSEVGMSIAVRPPPQIRI